MIFTNKIQLHSQAKSTHKIKKKFSFKSVLGLSIAISSLKNQLDTEKEYSRNGEKLKELEGQLKQYDPTYKASWVPFDDIGILRKMKDAFFCDGININIRKKIGEAEKKLEKYKKKQNKLDVSV